MNEREILQKITDEFYWFHRHPELSYEEVETTKRLRDDLAAAGIEVLDFREFETYEVSLDELTERTVLSFQETAVVEAASPPRLLRSTAEIGW